MHPHPWADPLLRDFSAHQPYLPEGATKEAWSREVAPSMERKNATLTGAAAAQGRQIVAERDPVERAAFWSGVWAGVAWSTAFVAGLYVGLSLVMALY